MLFHDLVNLDYKHYSTQINKTGRYSKSGKLIVRVVTGYICVYTHTIEMLGEPRKDVVTLDSDFAKVITKVEKNYQPTYRYTSYYHIATGNEITPSQFKLIK